MLFRSTSQTPADGYALGDTIEYQITATNDGNLTLTDINVTDELTGDEWTIDSLAPGASREFTATYTVTEADVLAGSGVQNVVSATGTSPDPEHPEVPADPGVNRVPVEAANGHLTVQKVTTSSPQNNNGYRTGEQIAYSITVTNDGNLTITNIIVTDDLTGDRWTIGSLAPGRNQAYTTTYTVTSADTQAQSVTNVATATGTSPDPAQPSVPVVPGRTIDATYYAGGGGGGGGGRVPVTPTDPTDPGTTIIDEDVPLAPIPEGLNGTDHFAYIKGYPDGTFLGDNAITRAEFVTIMVRFLNEEYTGENPFSDIDGHWAKDYILAAVGAGWINGYPDGTFMPDAYITRAEAMKIINSVLHRGVNASSELGNFINFPDNDEPSKWYYYEVIEASNDHEYEGSRPDENWTSNSVDYFYDIVKYEHPEV